MKRKRRKQKQRTRRKQKAIMDRQQLPLATGKGLPEETALPESKGAESLLAMKWSGAETSKALAGERALGCGVWNSRSVHLSENMSCGHTDRKGQERR